jgi:hypothetical protein
MRVTPETLAIQVSFATEAAPAWAPNRPRYYRKHIQHRRRNFSRSRQLLYPEP